MSDISKMPSLALPTDLQEKLRRLDGEIKALEKERRAVEEQISRRRASCRHRAIEGTENNYVTHCGKCGHVMDSWL